MIDWTRRATTEYEFVRVSWRTGGETDIIRGISREGGEIEENLNTATKISGAIDVDDPVDLGDDRIRIYARVRDSLGNSETIALATLTAYTPQRQHQGRRIIGRTQLYGMLTLAHEDGIDTPLVIPAGSHLVSTAAGILREAGLEVVSEESTLTTTRPLTFDGGTKRLAIANELLTMAGFGSADTDGYGRVVLSRYSDPGGSQPEFVFRDDERSIIYSGVEEERDSFGTPNRVVVIVSTPDSYMQAVAENRDPASPYSIPSRGRVITRTEELSDTPSQAALQAHADMLLTTSTRQMSSLYFSHGYVPLVLGSVQGIELAQSGLSFIGSLQERRMTLTPAMKCASRLRRFE